MTVFYGLPDTGKSMVAIDVAARVTRGLDFPDRKNPHPPSDVLMLVSEDDLDDTVVPRLMAAGADLTKVHFAKQTVITEGSTKKERRIALDTDLAAVEAKIREHSCIFAIIDPLTSYLGKVKRNKDEERCAYSSKR